GVDASLHVSTVPLTLAKQVLDAGGCGGHAINEVYKPLHPRPYELTKLSDVGSRPVRGEEVAPVVGVLLDLIEVALDPRPDALLALLGRLVDEILLGEGAQGKGQRVELLLLESFLR